MIKKRILSMLVLLAAVATGAWAQETYKVSVKGGTVDATSWTITPPEATTTGVAAGTPVTATYSGTKKVKSVKAKKASLINNPAVGQVIGSDGKNYDRTATLPSGVTAVAMIAYVGSETGVDGYTQGLALALSDKGSMTWSQATGASGAAAHTPAAPTPMTSSWMLPSKDQWIKMIDACKNVLGNNGDYRDLRFGFSGIGDNLEYNRYWSSTEDGSYSAWFHFFGNGINWESYGKDYDHLVRACLAF